MLVMRFLSDSVGIRTQDPQLRRLLLYPTELPNRPFVIDCKYSQNLQLSHMLHGFFCCLAVLQREADVGNGSKQKYEYGVKFVVEGGIEQACFPADAVNA